MQLLRLSASKEMAGLSCTNAILALMWWPVKKIGSSFWYPNCTKPLSIPSFLSCNYFLLLWELKRLNISLIIPNWRPPPAVPSAAHVWEDLLARSTQHITARAVAKGGGILGSSASSLCPGEAQERGGSGAQAPFRKFSVNSFHCRPSVSFCGVGIGSTQIIVYSWEKGSSPPTSEWGTLA